MCTFGTGLQRQPQVYALRSEKPGAITGFVEEEDRVRLEGLRKSLGGEAVKVLGSQPAQAMTYERLCLALRPDFFGQLKEGDYSKAIKQLVKDDRVLREQKGLRPKLLPTEKISLP